MSLEHKGTKRDFSGADGARFASAQGKRGSCSGTLQLYSQDVLPWIDQLVLNPIPRHGSHTSLEKGECKDNPQLLEQ